MTNENGMRKKFERIFGHKSRIVSQITLVALCIGLIAYFMPRERSIVHEDPECNVTWTKDAVKAKFHFTVNKSEWQLANERDSVARNLRPVFNYDESIGRKKLELLRKDLNAAIDGRADRIFATRERNHCIKVLISLYTDGIVPDAEIDIIRESGSQKIQLNDKGATETELLNVRSVSEAYQELIKCDTTLLQAEYDPKKYIEPNYIFARERTESIKNEELAKISPTLAIVKEHETIIEDGEVVDSIHYWKLKTYFNELGKKELTEKSSNKLRIFLGQIVFIVIAMLTLLSYIYIYRSPIAHNNNKFTFTILSATLFPVIVALMSSSGGANIFILPFAIVPMMLCLFIDHTTAFITNLTSIIICSIMLDSPYEFLLLQLIAGNSAILSLKELSSRSQMFRCVITTFLTYSLTYFCYELITEPDLSNMNYSMYIYFIISALLMMFIYPLMFLVEKTFGFISNVTLIELSNLNSKLLQRMSQEAPGTFQHSMQVGNLAAEAARAIGANSLEVRTGALYHDIGKLENPIYFTENQNNNINPHDSLTAIESAQVIINHVRDGITLAEKEKLPRKIKEFITTHHGVSKTGYFYITYKNEHPDEDVDESLFTYPGPRPTTREQAILMLADCVEAASHSIKEYTEGNINELVEKIVGAKMNEKELSLSPLTFQDVDTIKTVFKKRLMAIYHTRISYPNEKKRKRTSAEKQ